MWLIIKQFLALALKHKSVVLLYCLLSIALITVGLLQPYIYKISIDALTALAQDRNNIELQRGTFLFLVYGFGAGYGMTVIQSLKDWLYWSKLGNPLFVVRVKDNYQKILSLDIDHFISKKGGELMKTFDDGVEAWSNVNHTFWEVIFVPAVSFFALLAFAWFQNPLLTIICLFIVPIQTGWLYYKFKKTQPYSERARKGWHKLFGNMGDTISNILTTKSFQQEKAEYNKIEKVAAETLHHATISSRIWILSDLFDINSLSNSTIIIIGCFLVINNQATLGTVLMFSSILSRLMVPINILKHNVQQLQNDRIKFKELEVLLASQPKIISPSEAHSQKTVKGSITFKNVSFDYQTTKDTLKNVSLDIKPGEKIALVGHSGAGKSTLTMLMMRFYDVSKGYVSLDGIDLRKWDYENLRSHFGVVWQENTLFHTSVLNNIRYSKPTATLKEVQLAATQASANTFIEKLSKKYNSVVGERGVRLSGGEKQRIAIARALLKNPRIVILDEATSALDSITEKEVQKGILNLVKNRTAIIIAHRLSTVQHCDRIVVMDKGTVIAVGTHKELLKTCSQYKHMVTLQTHGFLKE